MSQLILGAVLTALFGLIAKSILERTSDIKRSCEIVICNLELLKQKADKKPFEQIKAEIHSSIHHLNKSTQNDINDFISSVKGEYYDVNKLNNIINKLKATASKWMPLFL